MRAVFLLAAAGLSAGCAAPTSFGDEASEPGAEAPAAFRVDGVVAVERVRTVDGAQTSVGAKFMRHAGSPEAAERLVGSRLLLPTSGDCASVADLEEVDAELTGGASPAAVGMEVELVDVGDVALTTDLAFASSVDAFGPEARRPYTVRLAPRAFPDVGELVSGVFYSSPDLGAPLPAPGQYAIEGTGAAAAAPFQIDAEAPAEPLEVRIGDADLASGARVRRGADVLVSWSRVDGVAPGDRVYVDVQTDDGDVHRCTFDDTGSAVLPGALVHGPSIAVAVHRLREAEVPLPAEIGDDSETGRVVVRFDLAVVGRVEVGASDPSGG